MLPGSYASEPYNVGFAFLCTDQNWWEQCEGHWSWTKPGTHNPSHGNMGFALWTKEQKLGQQPPPPPPHKPALPLKIWDYMGFCHFWTREQLGWTPPPQNMGLGNFVSFTTKVQQPPPRISTTTRNMGLWDFVSFGLRNKYLVNKPPTPPHPPKYGTL